MQCHDTIHLIAQRIINIVYIGLGALMRSFELDDGDVDENANFDDIRSLMDKMIIGAANTEFRIWEPNDGPLIVHVALSLVGGNEAWILSRWKPKLKTSIFLARGTGDLYYECIYRGCPEFVCDCCLHSRTDADIAIHFLIQRQKLQPDWHWVPMRKALQRLGG